MEVLGLEIMDSTKGEIIQNKLEELTKKVGVPLQIVADNGSDFARGIRLYNCRHAPFLYPELFKKSNLINQPLPDN